MTKRYASQLLLTPEGEWMTNAVLELSDKDSIERFYSLSELHIETAHTLFLDGVIAPSPLSLQEYLTMEDIIQLTEKYNYLNLGSESLTLPIHKNTKPLLIDFGSSDLQVAGSRLVRHMNKLSQFSLREIVLATCILPAQCLRELLLKHTIPECMVYWEDVDYAGDRLTINTRLMPLL